MHRLISQFEPRTVEHDYAGFALKVRLEDPLAQGWYDRDWTEPAEIRELRKGRLRTGARMFDLGAHQGVVALIVARIVGDGGAVVALEADPHNAAAARRNAVANGAQNLTVVHAAAGADNGVLRFAEGLNGNVAHGSRAGAIEVASLTVDELARRYGCPDVVLVDVEGYEAHVLEGARDTITAGSTDFFVELHAARTLAAAGSTADEVMRHFLGGGFEVAITDAEDILPQDGSADRETAWQDGSTSSLHRLGVRCFVVARPSGVSPQK